ncbi:hypothetical protein [Nocardia sp. AG03]|uniref:hypothetical protein n=1 Tax=Nocardia sp. AG03 TaxID=3025312 RepID=UPI0024186672|nr:hypothetical protein [Nocardia sp. AG03]
MAAHRPAQLARLGAVVAAGAASLCLTVAAGAYIVNHMPELTPPTSDQADPTASPNPGHPRPVLAEDTAPRRSHEPVELAFSSGRVEPTATRAAVHQSELAAKPDASSLAGRVRVGGTYVGAQVAPAQRDTVALTVDTNLGVTASKYLGIAADPTGTTALRTELDTRRGELVFVLTDPTLGTHTLRVQRVEQPATDPTATQSDPTATHNPPTEAGPTTVGV